MHKNAIKKIWGVKKCALFTKIWLFLEEKDCAPFLCAFWPFLAKLGAPLISKHLETLSTRKMRPWDTHSHSQQIIILYFWVNLRQNLLQVKVPIPKPLQNQLYNKESKTSRFKILLQICRIPPYYKLQKVTNIGGHSFWDRSFEILRT